jgi:hypothetical protein
LNRASGGASLVSRSREEALTEAVRVAISEVVQKATKSLLTQLHSDFKDSMINDVTRTVTDNPDLFVSNFTVIDEHEDMVMDEIWVTVEVEVNEDLLRDHLNVELK